MSPIATVVVSVLILAAVIFGIFHLVTWLAGKTESEDEDDDDEMRGLGWFDW